MKREEERREREREPDQERKLNNRHKRYTQFQLSRMVDRRKMRDEMREMGKREARMTSL
jgi:hypothetical protein